MATQISRKELKQDKFAVEVEHTVDFFAQHRQSLIRYGSVVVVLGLIAAAIFYYRSSQHSVRQQVLGEALALQNASVGQAPAPTGTTFPSEAAKTAAVAKAFQKIATDYPGSNEAYIAEYFLGAQDAAAGRYDDARKKLQDVGGHADADYASLARFELADIDLAQNRPAEAQQLLKDLMDHPTALVGKSQATIAYAKAVAPSKPDEARRLLNGLTTPATDVSPIATQALADLPAGK